MRDTYWLLAMQRGFAVLGRSIGYGAFAVASGLLITMSGILFLQVAFRYVLQLPLSWSEEAARFCLVWFGMLATCVAGQQGLHFSLRWGVNLLNPRPRELLRLFVLVFSSCILGFVAYQGFWYLGVVSTLTATATHLNLVWVYAAVPVGCLGMTIIYVCELADYLLAHLTGQHLGLWKLTEEMAYKQLLTGEDPC